MQPQARVLLIGKHQKAQEQLPLRVVVVMATPRSSSNGEVYAMSLFAEDPNYVLRQSTTTPYTFELLRTIDLNGRVLTRTFDMTKDARTLYFPDPGSAFVQVYESNDGTNYHKKENIVSLAAGCNAIHTQAGKSYFAVRSSGVFCCS